MARRMVILLFVFLVSVEVCRTDGQLLNGGGCLSHPDLELGGGCCTGYDCIVENIDLTNYCYCDSACYFFEDCCADILQIGCLGPILSQLLHFNMSDFIFPDSSGSGSGGSALEENPVMCFSSTDCGVSNGESPIIASSQEECCLMNPFQPRSFTTTKATAGLLGPRCVQCIVIGFSQNSLMTVEEQQILDNVRVQLYSGANDTLLNIFNVQFQVELSAIGSATRGSNGDFVLTSDLIQRLLGSSTTSTRITEILILDDDVAGEGVETFTLELTEPTFITKYISTYELSLTTIAMNLIDTSIFVHSNFSQSVVSIEDDDVILVKFTRNEFFGTEAGETSLVKISVVGIVTNDTDFFILPLTYQEYNEEFMPMYMDLLTISEIVGGVNLPLAANGDEFSKDPIPFTIPAGGSEPLEEIAVQIYDDAEYETQVEGLILLIMVNESTTNPNIVRFDRNRVALFQIIDYEDTYTLGFEVSHLDVNEYSVGNNKAVVPLRTTGESSTRIPIIVEFIVEDSSTATPGKDYEDINGTQMIFGVNGTQTDLVIPIYGDTQLELPETITVSLVAHVDLPFMTMCTFISYFELESRIILDLPTTTITIINSGSSEIMCYHSSSCGASLTQFPPSSSTAVFTMVSTEEECCLQYPIQPRSFQKTGNIFSCQECIVIGFEESIITTSENKGRVNFQVQFYSGSDDLLLGIYDVQFYVQLSSTNSATPGEDFTLSTSLIMKTLTSSNPTTTIDEVTILNDQISGEGTESFTMEITNPFFALKPENEYFEFEYFAESSIFLHTNNSKIEIAIEDDDVISVGFSNVVLSGSESSENLSSLVTLKVFGTVNITTDYYILPLMYEEYDAVHSELVSQFPDFKPLPLLLDNWDIPPAVKGEDFAGNPIPFSIPAGEEAPLIDIAAEILLDDTNFEPELEGFLLLIMINDSTTNTSIVRLLPDAVALFWIHDNEDTFTVGFETESVIVHENPASNKQLVIPISVASGNITEIPIILNFTVDNSSTATLGHDYEDINNASVVITNAGEFHKLIVTIYSDDDFSEPNETLVIFLSVDFADELTNAAVVKLQSRIFLELPTITITIVNSAISCYPSIDCGAIDGVVPNMVSTQEECCLQSPFQPRSFEISAVSAKSELGPRCAQCIVIGFKQRMAMTTESMSNVDDLQLQFYSGINDSLLYRTDIVITIQLSAENTATLGEDFVITSNPIMKTLTQMVTSVKLSEVLVIDDVNLAEGNESFTMKITNVTFIEKRGTVFSLGRGVDTSVFVRKDLNQTEVIIVDDDDDKGTVPFSTNIYGTSSRVSVATSPATPMPTNLFGLSFSEWLITIIAASISFLLCVILLLVCCVCCLCHKRTQKVSKSFVSDEIELKVQSDSNDYQRYRAGSAINVDPQDLKQLGGSSVILDRQLRLLDSIGEGEYGQVHKGHYFPGHSDMPTTVAIKTLKGNFSEEEVHAFLVECIQMKEFSHPNVMGLMGVCLDSGPSPYLILPFMAGGSLLAYLKKKRLELVLTQDAETNLDDVQKDLISMCLQIAKGMEYLASKKFVHRDLAARNCMLDAEGIIKVADFGLSKGLYEKMYFREDKKDGVKLPYKWMAIESLQDGLFSEKSDVWSFGVTCWEVFTGGRIPYAGVSPLALSKLLITGERMDIPNNSACSEEIFQLAMFQCWKEDPQDRPTFSELVLALSSKLTEIAGYLDLNEMKISTCSD